MSAQGKLSERVHEVDGEKGHLKTAVFWGCCILTNQYAYEMSVRQVLPKFDIELVDLSEAICCGDPIKSVSNSAATYLSARILSLAKKTGLENILIPCNRCHFTISEARKIMQSKTKLGKETLSLLSEEGLEYDENIRIWHTIDLLHDCIGIDRIKRAVVKPLKGLKVVSHSGCQIFRYSDLGRVDDAENPKKLDELIIALGAEVVDYPEKLDCCGASLLRSHPDSALSIAGSKLKAAQNTGVDGIIVSCPECQLIFDTRQKDAGTTVGTKLNVPVLYYTQLLGIAMGIEDKKLGLDLNQSPVEQLQAKVCA
jgi:heterodisulfide reductase subunit B